MDGEDMEKKNQGFTLTEMVVTISIFAILLGILVPSLNSVIGFRVQRLTNSIDGALDKTKTEAMNRLVAEMMLEKREDGYYISYYLDRGKGSSGRVVQDQPEKVGPSNLTVIYYEVKKDGTGGQTAREMNTGDRMILTYDRETGEFRPIQSDVLTQSEINVLLKNNQDIPFNDTDSYCSSIVIKGGFRTRIITLLPGGNVNANTGSHTVSAG